MGFDLAELKFAVADHNKKSSDEAFILPCLYIGRDDVDVLISHILGNVHADEDEYSYREGCGWEVDDKILSRLYFLSLMIKDSSFEYEKEWRVVIRDDDVQFRISKNTIEGKGHRPSGIFDGGVRKWFRRIVVAPHGNLYSECDMPRMNYDFLKNLCMKNRLRPEIVNSSSTYNGR